jgi:hypothetical protein
MKLPKDTWPILRTSLGWLCLSLALGVVLLKLSFYIHERMESSFKRQDSRLKDVSRKYLSIDDEKRIIQEDYPRFVSLYRRGVIEKEQRLNWLETLKRAEGALMIPSLQYEIQSSEPYTPDFGVQTGAFRINASTMKLNLGLLHEEDLTRFLRELDRNAAGLYSVKSCDFKRAQKEIVSDPAKENISAECKLLWYTLTLSNGNEIVLQ